MNLLNIGLGTGIIKVTVANITCKDVPIKNRNQTTSEDDSEQTTAKKIVLNCSNGSSDRLENVDEAWIKRGGQYQNKGLWLSLDDDGGIKPMSGLGKIMKYYGVTNLGDLVGMEIEGIYKSNGFLCLLTEAYEKGTEYNSNR